MRLSESPDIVIMGDPFLFQQHKQVCVDDIPTDDFQHNLKILRKRQLEANGIGIAAPQIGWGARVLCLGISEETRSRYPSAVDIPLSFWINPTILETSKDTCWTWEGCLSVPGMRGWVERPSAVKIRGFNEQGGVIEADLSGFPARVMLHELDHLNGLLFTDQVDSPKLLLSNDAFRHQDIWPEGWPTENARKASPGGLSTER
ncbi:peptide deformylase [uncultured Endozoicomonas sp.]|uniref:peptide deformylase n=1 Tax=uncultured Endozoicomonas sp. TaxID=432652 RepID=UPI0026341CBE|nr:peptide deformylase [uncultured Endozoicomonas sp.]